MSAYQQLKAALEALLPAGWKFTDHEPIRDLPDVTGVTMKIRTVRPLPAAPLGTMQVEWVLTVTSGAKSRASADPTLFDELIVFLGALDDGPEWLMWTEATKTVGDDDERLAYDIAVRTHNRRGPEVPDAPDPEGEN